MPTHSKTRISVHKQFSSQNALLLVLLAGLLIRLLLMVYTQHAGNWENINLVQRFYMYGLYLEPFISVATYHTGFYILFLPSYLPYIVLNIYGIYYSFLAAFLIKLPSLIGDVIALYALYKIGLLFTHDQKKSVAMAAAFFLNPYSIYLTSIISHPTSSIAAFILLSMIFLYENKLARSAFCLAFAASIQILPIFVLPGFLLFLWKFPRDSSLHNSSPTNLASPNIVASIKFLGHKFLGYAKGTLKHLSEVRLPYYLASFFSSCLLLFFPYLYISTLLYLSSPSMFFDWLNHFVAPVSSLAATATPGKLFGVVFNFTGMFNELNLAPYVAPFLGYRALILAYLAILIFKAGQTFYMTLSNAYERFHLLNQLIITFFCLFAVLIPLGQSHYLGWFLPFLVLEALLFHGIPISVFYLISFIHVMIDPIVGQNFYYYFDAMFPWLFPRKPGGIGVVQISLSGIYAVLLILVILNCLKRPEKQLNWKNIYAIPTKILVFAISVYSTIELLRISDISTIFLKYFIDSNIVAAVYLGNTILGTGLIAVFSFWCCIYAYKRLQMKNRFRSTLRSLFDIIKAPATLLQVIASIVVIASLWNNSMNFISPIVFLGIIWAVYAKIASLTDMKLYVFTFTSIYLLCILVFNKNLYLGAASVLYVLGGLLSLSREKSEGWIDGKTE